MDMFMPRTREWFLSSVGAPTEAQTLGWRAIAGGKDALISAPTGSGKTLAAFLFFLDALARERSAGALSEKLRVIYISPLKALGNDIKENLKRPLEALGLSPEVRVGVRTGDTEAKARRDMIKHPPHILITTPESVYLLLSSLSGRNLLKDARAVIVDEFHATASSKRGTHLMLSLARLDALCGRHLQRVALSATIRPLELAARQLSGARECAIIAPKFEKKIDLWVDSPMPDMRVLPEHSVWPVLADRVTDSLKTARTVLAFADGRASCERLAQKINERAGGILARTHHGCVSKEQRLLAETQLRSGELRVMVATSSMELGIDVGEIDEVVQIGCPSGVSALLQRLGRAGHSPGRVSRMRVYPRTASEGVSCALTARAALDGQIEALRAPEMCLDVLAQHLISMAACAEYTVDEAVSVLSGAYAYRELTRETVENVLRMLAGDYEHMDDKPVRPRLVYDRLSGRVQGDTYTRVLALSSGGTIPDRGWFAVTLPDGTRLGELDEEYVYEARLGDKFLLGAFAWRIVEITHDRVVVAASTPSGAASPFWKGDRAMRAYETGAYFGARLRELDAAARLGEDALIRALETLCMTEDAAKNAARVLLAQMRACGCLPTDKTIILEHFADEAGEHQLMVHSAFGGRVNRALSLLITREAARVSGVDARAYDDDDGILVYLLGGGDVPDQLLMRLNPETAADEVRAMLPASPMFSMAFRYNAARAMLMGARSGKRQPLWVQRLRGAETLAGAAKYADHPIVLETLRECCETNLDLSALTSLLTDIRAGRVQVLEMHAETPSPMSLNLRRQVEADLMYDSLIPNAAVQLARGREMEIRPDKAAVQEAYAARRVPKDIEALHTLLMTAGDILSEEIDAPFAWMEALAREGRALYVEPGLWIARENEEIYRQALSEGDDAALSRLTRRLSRFWGAQNAESVADRYAVPIARAQAALASLAQAGTLIAFEGAYLHKDVFESAQRRTVAMRRSAAKTAPDGAYAAMLAGAVYKSGQAGEQLRRALQNLAGEAHPLDAWEGYLLPARVGGYKPRDLDEALARGEAWYRVMPGDRPRAAFYAPEDEDMGCEAPLDALDDAQKRVYLALKARGASFARSLSAEAGAKGAGEILFQLAALGLARADSFAPVRRMLAGEARTVKGDVRGRVHAMDAGRWEICRAQRAKSAEARVNALFDRYTIACRETAREGDWPALLEVLRRMEYAGKARRGYFVRGMSGAQFVREEDAARVALCLAAPGEEFHCLCAADPLQPWGAVLKHMEGRQFQRLASACVVLRGGAPVAVFEKQGEVLRAFDEAFAPEAVQCFASAYRAGLIFPSARRVVVKSYPDFAAPALSDAGFSREMLDYVLLRASPWRA